MEYLLYQTLVGAWPLPSERAVAYMNKAAKEAKEHTSWITPDETYDAALASFVEAVLDDRAFTADLADFVAPLVEPGRTVSLAQTLLKVTSPGTPDFYQGSEIWDLSLVDPDNRRPVDYGARRRLLAEVKTMSAEEAWTKAETGAPKMFLIHRALKALARFPHPFDGDAGYSPLAADGVRADNVVAYSRGGKVIVVVPRLVMSVGGRWDDTSIALPGRWTNVFTETAVERRVALRDLLDRFPVAMLVKDGR